MAAARQEIALLIRTVVPCYRLLHYLNFKARYRTLRKLCSRWPCFSFISSAEKPFIKLSAPIIYISTRRRSQLTEKYYRNMYYHGSAKISASDQSAFCVKWNGNRLALNYINCQPLWLRSTRAYRQTI